MNSGVVDVSQYSSWKEILLLEEVNRESLANMRKEIQRMLATTKQQKTVSMTIKDGLVLLVELHDVLSANLKKKGPLMEILKTEVEQSTRWSPEKEGKDLIRKRLHSEAPDSRASRESEGELTDITAFPGATFRDTIPGNSRVEESKLGKEDKLINKSEEEEMETDSEGSSQTVTDSDSLNAPHKLRFRKDKKDLSKEAQRKAAREAEREADRLKRIQKQAEAEKRKKEAERNKREEEAKQRTERDKRRKQADTINRKKRRKRPQALVIKVSETLPYAEVLRKLKLSVKPADTNTEIRAIRKTMGGDVMLEMEPSCGITESFRKSVEDAVGGGLVKDLKPRASLEIRDIDSLTPADEVRAGIERKLGGPREDLTVNLTAPNGRQQILAIVSLAGGDAEKLVKNDKIVGVVDYGTSRKDVVANQALVAMIKGTTTAWKQVMGHWLTGNEETSSATNVALFQCLDALESATQKLPPSSVHTAQFVLDFNNLFDCFNSSKKSHDKLSYRYPISATSSHKTFLWKMLQDLKLAKFIGCTRQPDCLNGWMLNIRSLLYFSEYMESNHGERILRTRLLNQDALENTFSVVRQQHGCSDHPTSKQLETGLKSLTLASLGKLASNSNCEKDLEYALVQLSNLRPS
ncbi:hypothetical protein GE061_009637 [Apolygus lucorum]|uniref:Uncharacterized protein n=1 Tax=Apolygus lucorum TaxID=248454 RepID=A0A8S9Y0T3_APOLU|nr:hypothetical protein GE061_009637 [Apolygus lucorum]